MQRMFKILLEQDEEDGGYTVTVPELPGCITEGDTLQEAFDNAQEAIIGYLEALKIQGESIPEREPTFFFGEVRISA